MFAQKISKVAVTHCAVSMGLAAAVPSWNDEGIFDFSVGV
jgi:hypothetical protein